MNTIYLVRDPDDWQGAAFVIANRDEAYELWSENQDWEVLELEYTGHGVGKFWNASDDFADEYVADCREARALKRHYASFAPCRRTHL